VSSSAPLGFFRDRRFEDEDPGADSRGYVSAAAALALVGGLQVSPCAFFLLRLDFRLDEADCAFSEGGMDGPATDLVRVSRWGSEEGMLKASYPGLDIVGACFPFLFLREYAGCGGGAGVAAG
jgi:hypothetical protein